MFVLMGKFSVVEWIESILLENGMTKADLAKVSGISPAQITRIMSGEQSPGIDSIVGLSRGLGRTPCEVFCRVAGINYVEKSEDLRVLSGKYSRLSENGRQELLKYADYLFMRGSE